MYVESRNQFSLPVQSTNVGWYRAAAQAGQGFPADAPYRSAKGLEIGETNKKSVGYRVFQRSGTDPKTSYTFPIKSISYQGGSNRTNASPDYNS
ncbi:hypothetical protein Q8F57_042270 [Paraburkholderia terrae]|uniref:hypothetical protein n=1 Tax=Paraburkholderia terrae TaxID=311230 RepID=UPI00296AFE9E|nr:hypothetical protein [Paraburkholderia terrae]MDW3660216.1 hypothetical protein [Paraburkholderia terrae]